LCKKLVMVRALDNPNVISKSIKRHLVENIFGNL